MQELIIEQVLFCGVKKINPLFIFFLAKITVFVGILQLQQAT